MKKTLLAALIATGLNANAQRTTSNTQKTPATKTTSTTTKIITPVLKTLKTLSDIQIANALYVEIGLDNDRGVDNDILNYYTKSNTKVVNVAEIIHDKKKYYLVDRLYADGYPNANNRGYYEDKGNLRSTVVNNPYQGDYGSGNNPWVSHLNQEEVNKFRVSSRDKTPIELVASDISVMCQKEGDSFVERLQLGNDSISQHFIKGTHSYIISVDRSGKVTSIRSKDMIVNNQPSDNYNICSERLITKIKNFKFKDDLDAPASRTYAITIKATVKGTASNIAKFVHEDNTYLSDYDPSRKFYTDSIRIASRMNDAMKDLKLVESRRDSTNKSLTKNREDILKEFKTNYATYVEKDRQRLLKEEWGGKLDPKANSYDRTLEMILAQAKANTDEKFHDLESSTRRDLENGMLLVSEEYNNVYDTYINLKSEYESLQRPYSVFSNFQ